MRTKHVVAGSIVVAVATALSLRIAHSDGPGGGASPAPVAPPAAISPLVVHEWGTFTSVAGSDGVGLEGLQHEEEGLPRFVYSRTKVRECPLRQYGYKGLEVPVEHVTQKMETPVLYFHTDSPRRVRVRVDFVKGLISQWYPVSDLIGPPEASVDAGPLDLSKVERSFLEWDVDVLAKGAEASPAPPAVAADDPWAFARDVDASLLRTVPRQGPERLGPTESEKFLFYRGLGTFALPYSVRAEPRGKARFANGGAEDIPFAFAFQNFEKGGAAFRAIGRVAAKSDVDASLDPDAGESVEKIAPRLKAAVTEALVAQGLFADEAKAMVETWSRQWFLSTGTRIVYGVPRARTDAILPLHVDPKPDAVVRVLVGRLEFMTPEQESLVERALAWRLSREKSMRDASTSILASLGRFLEPHVRRVLATTTDAEVRKSAEEVLAAAK